MSGRSPSASAAHQEGGQELDWATASVPSMDHQGFKCSASSLGPSSLPLFMIVDRTSRWKKRYAKT